MKKIRTSLNIAIPIIVIFSGLLNSCAPAKNVVYFQNLQKDTTLHSFVDSNLELKIRKNDLLYIGIISPDPESTPWFNGIQSMSSSAAAGANTGISTSGFLVDKNGDITMYKLGTLHVEGLTRTELKQQLQKDVEPYLKDAAITIRFLNNRVTMLGELAKPGIITLPNEQIPLLEAIAISGDVTLTGRRDNILVIRDTEKGKQFKRVNLTDHSIFKSPFYYLKPDDIVYVEPTSVKIKSASQTPQTVSYVLSAASILITIIALLRK